MMKELGSTRSKEWQYILISMTEAMTELFFLLPGKRATKNSFIKMKEVGLSALNWIFLPTGIKGLPHLD